MAGAPQVPPKLARWLTDALDDPGPFELEILSGGNSNETAALRSPLRTCVLRRPPPDAISPSAHSMEREFRMLRALEATDVPAPAALALCSDADVPGAPFLVMEVVNGCALRETLPPGLPSGPATVTAIGEAVIDALASLHTVDWKAIGLGDFGRPGNFLARQVPRWSGQLERYRTRRLPWFDEVGEWLAANVPPDGKPGVLHGDFHLDNCLVAPQLPIRVLAIIDWETATIGDPLLDLGLFLAYWGPDRPPRPSMPSMQGVTRIEGVVSRQRLSERYAEASGRSVEHLSWYMALGCWKLAAIIEGAYAQFVNGTLVTPYAASLDMQVPMMIREAAGYAGLLPAR